ncbi:MAG: hypothetical protein WEB30_18645 [Cyclobacteriaceae bacterium]
MRTCFKTDTTSFANSFLLLVMVAGVLNIDLFESDAVSGYNDHKVFYRIELVFNAEYPSLSPVLSIYEDIPGNDAVEDSILPSHSYATCFGTALFVIQYTGQVNTRPIYSSHNHTSSFNIPHQNSDEDEAFIFPADVA